MELLQLPHAHTRSWEEEEAVAQVTSRGLEHELLEGMPLQERVRGWLDYVTRLDGNFPLNVTTERNPFNCQLGNCEQGKCRPDFYLGGRFQTLDPNLLETASGTTAGARPGAGKQGPDVVRVCKVGKGVKYIVSPIINIVTWLCGSGFQNITTECPEKLLKIDRLFFPALLNMTYRVKLDGKTVLSDSAGKASQVNVLYLTEKPSDLFLVGPPDYRKTLSAGIPEFESPNCAGKKPRLSDKILGTSVGYYIAVSTWWYRPRTLEYEARLVDANIDLDFSLSVKYTFTYAY